MSAFTQYLISTNKNKQLKEAFLRLEQKGISSIEFVEWYTTEAELLTENELIPATEKWIKSKLKENVTADIQHEIESAAKALSDLNLRLNRSPNLRANPNSKNIEQIILSLLNMLQHPDQIVQEIPQQQQQQQQPQQQNPVQPQAAENYIRFINKKKLMNVFEQMQNDGIDIDLFVEWYKLEGQFLNEGPYFDKFKDFAANTWANIKGAWNRGLSNWGQEGQQRQQTMDAQRDKTAIENAMKAIQDLIHGISDIGMQPQAEFMKMLQQIQQQLQTQQTQPVQPQQPVQPNNQQTQPVQPNNQPVQPQPAQQPPTMKKFAVEGMDARGDIKKVTISAANQEEAMTKIKANGLYITKLEEIV